MRWILRIAGVVFVAWAAFMASPFYALHDLARAVEARDANEIAERVNFRALRLSLTKQIVDAYLVAHGRAQEIGASNRNLASAAGASLADPLVRDLLTPEAILDLLDDGWPQAKGGPPPAELAGTRFAVDWTSVGEAARLFMASETRGFRKIYMPIPPDRPKAERFTLYWRLSGTTWRLTGVDLPASLQQRLIRELPRPTT
ncbi:MAG TPA: DUF2939 domain-containing protein [Microvirga sp.]|jgi:hypothetical protein|nr:DUF2939 domain-containing protein [Microvirga sp.]